MIQLRRVRTTKDIHPDFTGTRLSAKLIVLAEQRIALGKDMKFEGKIGDWKKMKDALKRHTFGKCAYCEAYTDVVAHGDVEHFRPKVTYWWLALCVDNYVFACQVCNQSYKGDDFPIQGKRLNPVDPGENFAEKWNRPSGEGDKYRTAFREWHADAKRSFALGLEELGSTTRLQEEVAKAFGTGKTLVEKVVAGLPADWSIPGLAKGTSRSTIALAGLSGEAVAGGTSQSNVGTVDRLG